MKAILISIPFMVVVVVIAIFFVLTDSPESTKTEKPKVKSPLTETKQRTLKDSFNVIPDNKVLSKGRNLFLFAIKQNNEKAYAIDSAVVTITKPTTTRFDWSYEAKLQPDGKYGTILDIPDFGQWEIRVSFMVNNETLTYPLYYTVR